MSGRTICSWAFYGTPGGLYYNYKKLSELNEKKFQNLKR
jgi:hypothetical protein